MSQRRKAKTLPPIIDQELLACRRILEVTEEELCRIVLDIHDGPVQKLFVALSQINLLQQQLEKEDAQPAKLKTALRRIARLLEDSQRDIRTFLGAFRPPGFRQRDLLPMLKELIIQHEEWTGNRVDLEVASELPPVDVPTKIALYRIMQEALSNAYRHASVDRHSVRLWADDGSVWMEVADEGVGFEPPPLTGPAGTEREEHIGLRGMRERVAMLGGNFELESRPGKGTRITVQVPWHD
ncbi:MAG: sensor histidine kinase [Dehalococcoidia bacterium]